MKRPLINPYPASCGKILTALTVMDLVNMDEVCTVSSASAAVPEASFYLEEEREINRGAAVGKPVNREMMPVMAFSERCQRFEPLFVYLLNLKGGRCAGSAELKNTNGLPAEGHDNRL